MRRLAGNGADTAFSRHVHTRGTNPPVGAWQAEVHEVLLDEADGLDWETLCKCDVVYTTPKTELVKRRGSVTAERRPAIAEQVIRSLGLAGL